MAHRALFLPVSEAGHGALKEAEDFHGPLRLPIRKSSDNELPGFMGITSCEQGGWISKNRPTLKRQKALQARSTPQSGSCLGYVWPRAK